MRLHFPKVFVALAELLYNMYERLLVDATDVNQQSSKDNVCSLYQKFSWKLLTSMRQANHDHMFYELAQALSYSADKGF